MPCPRASRGHGYGWKHAIGARAQDTPARSAWSCHTKHNDPRCSKTTPTRTGSAYLLAVIVTAILTTVGLASLSIVSRAHDTAQLRQGVGNAQTAIVSGIELAQHRLTRALDWQTRYSLAPIVDREVFGSATVTVNATALDPKQDTDIRLIAQASAGQAEQKVIATLSPTKIPVASLASALHATGDIAFDTANVVADAPITSNASVVASGSDIDAPVRAVGSISGGTFFSTTQQGITPITSPDVLFIEQLALQAVQIPYNALPSGRIENMLLSPTNQPFTGVTHPDGLYAIDCGGANITLRDCRIVGTLILLNAGASSIIDGAVLIEPARPDRPSLIVKGSITVRLRTMALLEADIGVNLNPPGTPYNGTADTLIDDRYPSEIRGAVVITDTLSTRKRAVFRGSASVGQLDARGLLTIQHNKALERNPPKGFIDHYTYSLVPGTWLKAMR